MFVLKGVLRAESQEKVLLYLYMRQNGYANGIAEFFRVPTNPVQKQLARLEQDGVIISRLIGKTREYQFNPRYAFLAPLKDLLKAALAVYPQEIKAELGRGGPADLP